MRVNLLIAMIIFALIWPATALRAAVSKTTWADAPAREFVFVENVAGKFTSFISFNWLALHQLVRWV